MIAKAAPPLFPMDFVLPALFHATDVSIRKNGKGRNCFRFSRRGGASTFFGSVPTATASRISPASRLAVAKGMDATEPSPS